MISMKRFPVMFTLSALAIIVIGGILVILVKSDDSPKTKNQTQQTQTNAKQKPVDQLFDKSQYSLDDPVSIWVVVNKTRPLSPKSYQPVQRVIPDMPLRSGSGSSEMQISAVISEALAQMTNEAKANRTGLMLASGYRSYNLQVSVYNNEVQGFGQAVADTESARPGYSEHQTGLAVDLEPTNRQCELQECFADLPEGKWLAANAYRFGFIIRYPQDKDSITGYRYEPWHVRFVGTALAAEMRRQGVSTLEEFFGLPAAPNYP